MDATFFKGNRHNLLKSLPADSFVAMSGFGSVQRDIDQPFAFQQEGNFWYLTGIQEPGWQLFIDTATGNEWLVAPQLTTYQRTFDGGLSPQSAAERSGITTVITPRQAKQVLANLLASKKRVYTLVPRSARIYGFQPNASLKNMVRTLKNVQIEDIRGPLATLRAIKQPAEIAALQQAVDITIAGITSVAKQLRGATHEYHVDAALYYEFRNRGATHAFDPIIASGHKTCILHAPAANDPLGDWLLMDVGAKVNGYCADITRTLPLQPPTERQQKIYEAVERSHDYFLSLLKPDAVVKTVLMEQVYPYIGEQMVKLGLIKKPLLTSSHVFKYMPHSITHGLGVDVHDPLGKPETFKEGMVLTNEVGIYIPEENFGVRIENDMHITKDGAINMAAALPTNLHALAKMVY